MKILYLSSGCFDKGGISRYNRYQIKALKSINNVKQIRVMSLLGKKDNDFEEEFKVFWKGSQNLFWSKIRFTFVMLYQVFFNRPEILWVGHVNLSGLAWLFSRISRSKTVLNVYGLEVWSNLSTDAEFGLKKCDYVISDCHNTADYLEKSGFRDKGTTTVIWDCVDLNKFKKFEGKFDTLIKNYKLPSNSDNKIILSLGRLSFAASHKGYERLLKVFSIVIRKFHNVKLVFAGKGDMVNHLKKLAAKWEIEKHVFFTGPVHENDLATIYTYADIFSLVSDAGEGRGEGIPLTPLEAMSCKTPIIVGNQDGSREAIFNNSNGYSIDPFDLELHAARIIEILNDEKRLEKMGMEGRKISEMHFDYHGFVLKHQKFINGNF